MPRGRPPGFDRDTALNQAMLVFWREGYDVPVPAICTATGLSASSLYNTFGSKRELFDAALERYLEAPMDFVLGGLEHGSQGLADLDAFFGTLMQADALGLPRGCLCVNTIAELPHPATSVYRARLRRSLAAMLARAVQAGETVAGVASDATVDALVGIVIAFNLLRAAGVDDAETAQLIAAARAVARS